MSEDGRLRWQCRRGLLELDLVLQRFLDTRLGGLSAEERVAFGELIAMPDNDLWDLIIGKMQLDEPPGARRAGVLEMLRNC